MRNDICNIPVSEVFEIKTGCPVCETRAMLKERVITYILGAAMMEPDVRQATNRLGFCHRHLCDMTEQAGKLPLALMLSTHLDELKKNIFINNAKRSGERAKQAEQSCFICDKIEWGMSRLLDTVYRLYGTESDFRVLFSQQKYLCLPHYGRMVTDGQKSVSKRYLPDFTSECRRLAEIKLDGLKNDIKHFCDMFDYRNAAVKDFKNSEDAIERTVQWLTSFENNK